MEFRTFAEDESLEQYFSFFPYKGSSLQSLNEKDITEIQQNLLNESKDDVVRENEIYLLNHPEIRTVIIFILNKVLKQRPKVRIKEFIGRLFNQPYYDLVNEIDNYTKLNNK